MNVDVLFQGYTSDNQGYTSERESNKPSNKPRTLQRAVKELWVSSHDLTKDITEVFIPSPCHLCCLQLVIVNNCDFRLFHLLGRCVEMCLIYLRISN